MSQLIIIDMKGSFIADVSNNVRLGW